MERAAVEEVFKAHWKKGWGSVSAGETMFIFAQIERFRPRSFIEIGMASGLSGGLIASQMAEHGGELFYTLDHDNTFFGDTTKENGFLIGEIYKGSQVKVEKRPFTTALDIETLNQQFDMAFIDANHQHPWPLIDTLCLYPFMTGRKLAIHHDLRLFKNPGGALGIGPKYLFDQFPEAFRWRAAANKGNIFFVDLRIEREKLEALAIDCFSLPWTLRTPLSAAYIEKISGVLERHYSADVLAAFEANLKRFNFRRGDFMEGEIAAPARAPA